MLMDYRDEEKLLRDSVASFAERVLRERVRPFVEKHAFPTDLVREFGALGFMGTAYDPTFDGAERRRDRRGNSRAGRARVCRNIPLQ